jgi:hypothetical protein
MGSFAACTLVCGLFTVRYVPSIIGELINRRGFQFVAMVVGA